MRQILIFSWLLISLLVVSPLSFAAESDVDKLLDLLVERKLLTTEDAAGFREDLAVIKQEEKEKQKEFVVIAGRPIKINGYTQVRYRQDKSINDTFDIRRTRLDIKGDITEKFDYRLQTEFAGSSPKLLDATAGYKFNPYAKLTIGQFKIPFSQENLISSSKLETINRSQVVEALSARGTDVIGNQNGRDIGIQLGGSIFSEDSFSLFDYALGVFNGSGINKVDNNEAKDFVGRLVYHPAKEWAIGGSLYKGRGSWGTPLRENNRDRAGVEVAYVENSISLKGEYIWGNDASINKQGWYIQGGYFVIPKELQGILKFDTFDPNTATGNDETNIYTFGFNWYFNKWVFLQVNYELKDEHGEEIDNNALIGQLTVQF